MQLTKSNNDENLPAVPEAWADYEAQDDIGTFNSYYNEYRYSVKLKQDTFQIIDNTKTDNKVVYQSKKLMAQILYAHITYKLPFGIIDNPNADYSKLSDEEKKAAASSLASPFSSKRSSRGNFDINGYGQYVDNPELRKLVRKRQAIIFRVGGVPDLGSELILASLPATTIKAFDDYNKFLLSKNVSYSYIATEITAVPAVNQNKDEFFQVTFNAAKGKNTQFQFLYKTPAEWQEKGQPIKQECMDKHEFFMHELENRMTGAAQASYPTPPQDDVDASEFDGDAFVSAADVFPE